MTAFSKFPEIRTGFSSAADGTMAIVGGFENRQKYLAAHGCEPVRTVHAGLSHGTHVAVVSARDGGHIINETDGLITADPHVGLAMTSADCLLILGYDPVRKIIGLVHAGSKGLASSVVTVFFDVWKKTFSSQAKDIVVHVLPSICPQHYIVSEDFALQFSSWPVACQVGSDGTHLDLRFIARAQLLAGGILPAHISVSSTCTFEDLNLFSYRRDHTDQSSLQVGYIMRPD